MRVVALRRPEPAPVFDNRFRHAALTVGSRLEFRGWRPGRDAEAWTVVAVLRRYRWQRAAGTPAEADGLIRLRNEASGETVTRGVQYLARSANWYVQSG